MIPFSKLHEMKWNRTSVVVEEASETGVTGPMENVLSKKSDHIEDLTKTGLVHYGDTDFLSIPLSMDNMVLRGTRLKNTDYIYGIVVYTGKDTRLGRNLQKSDAKMSTLERYVISRNKCYNPLEIQVMVGHYFTVESFGTCYFLWLF